MTDKRDKFFSSSSLQVAVILLLAFLVYSNTFTGPFVYDDYKFIVNNPEIKDLSRLWPPSGTRWFGFLSFAVNYRIGWLNTTGYHVVNLSIHLLNTLFVYWLVVLTFRTPFFRRSVPPFPVFGGQSAVSELYPDSVQTSLVAFFSAVLFAGHPIQTQAVSYIWQRVTALATLFYLLSLVLYAQAMLLNCGERRSPRDFPSSRVAAVYAASLLSAILAMMTKEISFTLPFVIVLYEFTFFTSDVNLQKRRGRRILSLLPFVMTLAIIPWSLFGSEPGMDGSHTTTEELRSLQLYDTAAQPAYQYLLTQFRVIATYIRLLFLPVGQNLLYEYPTYTSFFDHEVFLSFLLHLLLLVFAGYLLYASGRRNVGAQAASAGSAAQDGGYLGLAGSPFARLAAFGIFWFFITLSVESSIIPIKHVIFEHRLYLPSIGFFVALTALVGMIGARWEPARKSLLPVLALASLAFSIGAYARNAVWADDRKLWEDVVWKSPNRSEPHSNLGVAYANAGDYDKAIQEYMLALKIAPDYQDARVNLTKVYIDQGQDDKAIEEIAAGAGNPALHNNLGLIYAKQGRMESALNEFLAALRMDPRNADVHYNIGRLYAEKGDITAAIKEYRDAVTINPDLIDAHYNLGVSYADQGRIAESMREFQEVLRRNPQDDEARSYLEMLRERVSGMQR